MHTQKVTCLTLDGYEPSPKARPPGLLFSHTLKSDAIICRPRPKSRALRGVLVFLPRLGSSMPYSPCSFHSKEHIVSSCLSGLPSLHLTSASTTTVTPPLLGLLPNAFPPQTPAAQLSTNPQPGPPCFIRSRGHRKWPCCCVWLSAAPCRL